MSIEDAVMLLQMIKTEPTEHEKIQLYALNRQALYGDCNEELINDKCIRLTKRHNAWNELRGMTCEDALNNYIKFITFLINKK